VQTECRQMNHATERNADAMDEMECVGVLTAICSAYFCSVLGCCHWSVVSPSPLSLQQSLSLSLSMSLVRSSFEGERWKDDK